MSNMGSLKVDQRVRTCLFLVTMFRVLYKLAEVLTTFTLKLTKFLVGL